MITPNNPHIQAIVDQYKGLGWEDVRPLEMGGPLPRIVCWKGNAFSIHLELFQAAKGSAITVNFINVFTKFVGGAIGGFWFKGHHLTPDEVQAIVRIVTGQVVEIETEAVEETGSLAEHNRYKN